MVILVAQRLLQQIVIGLRFLQLFKDQLLELRQLLIRIAGAVIGGIDERLRLCTVTFFDQGLIDVDLQRAVADIRFHAATARLAFVLFPAAATALFRHLIIIIVHIPRSPFQVDHAGFIQPAFYRIIFFLTLFVVVLYVNILVILLLFGNVLIILIIVRFCFFL